MSPRCRMKVLHWFTRQCHSAGALKFVRDLLEITDDYVCAVHPVSSTLIEKHSRTKKLRNFSVSVGCIDWECTSTVQNSFCKCELRGLYLTPGQTKNNRNWGVGHMNWGVKPLPPTPLAIPTLKHTLRKNLGIQISAFYLLLVCIKLPLQYED